MSDEQTADQPAVAAEVAPQSSGLDPFGCVPFGVLTPEDLASDALTMLSQSRQIGRLQGQLTAYAQRVAELEGAAMGESVKELKDRIAQLCQIEVTIKGENEHLRTRIRELEAQAEDKTLASVAEEIATGKKAKA